jgi:FlaA1/EpsC-like NDP-sugar epimerase
MGASKWITERIVESLQESSNNGKNPSCRLMYARFGNVLSSSGSVFTIFVRQLLSGEPLTITDPHATRYFMSLREAGSLVIQAGAMGKGGDALVLRMGRPISILDLAHRIVREINDNHLPRPRNGKEVAMRIVGLRDGEKKHEQLFSSGPPQSTGHPMIVRELAKPIPWPTLSAELETLRELAERASDSAAKELVYDLIGTRTPIAIP